MIFSLALRNVLRNIKRLAPMMFSIIIIFTLLIAGNAVLKKTNDSLYEVYSQHVVGDLTISPVPDGENNFTIFGSDQLLVGQYLIPPTIVTPKNIQQFLDSQPTVRKTAGLISSAARIEIGSKKKTVTLLGVDFKAYSELVPGLQLENGSFPEPGKTGIIVQKQMWDDNSGLVGKKALLFSTIGRNFTLREVPVTGVFSYPVSEAMLDNVVLVDADTARAMNGYLYGSKEQSLITEDDYATIEASFDDLFSDNTFLIEESTSENDSVEEYSAVNPESLFTEDDTYNGKSEEKTVNERKQTTLPEYSESAWNFLLVSLYDRNDIKKVREKLFSEGYTEDNGYLVRRWNSSVGSNAQLAWFLQLIFNTGLLFVSFAAVIIAANALLLSVLERTSEIGTLRAMGASQLRIGGMIFLETLFVVFCSAVMGIILGHFFLKWLNNTEIIIKNPYIQILFGGGNIKGAVSTKLVINHLLTAALLTFLSMLYPLKHALNILPAEAMAE